MNETSWWSRCWRKLSCRPWRKLHCGPLTEVVSHATPPHLVKIKINFDEAQKLTWKEIKCSYGLIKTITSNNISELLKMQLKSRSRNVHTLLPRERASKAILVSRAFAIVFSRYKLIIALSLYFFSWALQHTVHISIIAAKIVSQESFFELQYFGLDLRLARTKTAIPIRMQTADCRLKTGGKMQTRYKMQIADWVYTVFSSDTW